jgi:hypothetical protein
MNSTVHQSAITRGSVAQTAGSEATIVVCAVIVGGVWAFRTLYETGKATGEALATETSASKVKTLAGLTAHPAKPAEFIVGFGFVFFSLSVIALPAPELAKMFAVLIAVGTTLGNGATLFKDISTATSTVTTAESGPTTQLVTPKAATGTPPENQVARSKVVAK